MYKDQDNDVLQQQQNIQQIKKLNGRQVKVPNKPNYQNQLDSSSIENIEENATDSIKSTEDSNNSTKKVTYEKRPNSLKQKIFKCDQENCGKIFKAKNSLKDHIRIHQGIKPYCCSWSSCGKKFTQQSSLQKHFRIHKGEKPYKCQICTLAFTQISNLKRHIRIHTNEKPFMCRFSNCKKIFNTTSNRKQHEQIHKNHEERLKFECEICQKVYYYMSNLKKHTVRHIRKGIVIPESQLKIINGLPKQQNLQQQETNNISLGKRQIQENLIKIEEDTPNKKVLKNSGTNILNSQHVSSKNELQKSIQVKQETNQDNFTLSQQLNQQNYIQKNQQTKAVSQNLEKIDEENQKIIKNPNIPQVKLEDYQQTSKPKLKKEIFIIQKFTKDQWIQEKLQHQQKINNQKLFTTQVVNNQQSQAELEAKSQLSSQEQLAQSNEINKNSVGLSIPQIQNNQPNLMAFYINPQLLLSMQQQIYSQQINSFFQNQQMIIHNGHIDFLINGYLYFFDGQDINIHELEVSDTYPDQCKKLEEISHVPNQKSLEIIFKKIQENTQKLLISNTGSNTQSQLNLQIPTKINIFERSTNLTNEIHAEKCQPNQFSNKSSINNIFTIEKNAHKQNQKQTNSYMMFDEQQKILDKQLSKIYQVKNYSDPNTPQKKLNHIHSDKCGHGMIYHNGHIDYIVGDTLHHPHDMHCDNHGKIQFYQQN